MRFPRALILSLALTLTITVILQFFCGVRTFGLFLFLPFGFLFARKSPRKAPRAEPRIDDRPIEPR